MGLNPEAARSTVYYARIDIEGIRNPTEEILKEVIIGKLPSQFAVFETYKEKKLIDRHVLFSGGTGIRSSFYFTDEIGTMIDNVDSALPTITFADRTARLQG